MVIHLPVKVVNIVSKGFKPFRKKNEITLMIYIIQHIMSVKKMLNYSLKIKNNPNLSFIRSLYSLDNCLSAHIRLESSRDSDGTVLVEIVFKK